MNVSPGHGRTLITGDGVTPHEVDRIEVTFVSRATHVVVHVTVEVAGKTAKFTEIQRGDLEARRKRNFVILFRFDFHGISKDYSFVKSVKNMGIFRVEITNTLGGITSVADQAHTFTLMSMPFVLMKTPSIGALIIHHPPVSFLIITSSGTLH